jgi:hypothetical protein
VAFRCGYALGKYDGGNYTADIIFDFAHAALGALSVVGALWCSLKSCTHRMDTRSPWDMVCARGTQRLCVPVRSVGL